MRVLLAGLIVLGLFCGSAAAFAVWGASKVGSHVAIEKSCLLLEAAENEGWLSKSQRYDVIQKVASSVKLGPSVREAAGHMRTACPKRLPTAPKETS
jgi:hypothetical protein